MLNFSNPGFFQIERWDGGGLQSRTGITVTTCVCYVCVCVCMCLCVISKVEGNA